MKDFDNADFKSIKILNVKELYYSFKELEKNSNAKLASIKFSVLVGKRRIKGECDFDDYTLCNTEIVDYIYYVCFKGGVWMSEVKAYAKDCVRGYLSYEEKEEDL